MIRRLSLVLLVVVVFAAHATGFENVGGLVHLGASARGLGLGGAFSALVDDEAAVFYNPAALGAYEGVGVTSLFARQFGGVTYGVIGVAVPYFGAGIVALDSGAIPSGSSTFRYASQGVIASAGVPIGPVGLGVRWRFFRISSPFNGSGWSVDPAILVATETLRLSLIYESALSAPVSYAGGAEEAWDQGLRLGGSMTLSPGPEILWTPTVEVGGLFTTSIELLAGLEAWISGLGARVGYDGEGPTFGLSVRFESLQFDWAYAMRSDLGNSHRVTFTLRF